MESWGQDSETDVAQGLWKRRKGRGSGEMRLCPLYSSCFFPRKVVLLQSLRICISEARLCPITCYFLQKISSLEARASIQYGFDQTRLETRKSMPTQSFHEGEAIAVYFASEQISRRIQRLIAHTSSQGLWWIRDEPPSAGNARCFPFQAAKGFQGCGRKIITARLHSPGPDGSKCLLVLSPPCHPRFF